MATVLLAGCTTKVKEAITIPTQMEKKIASIHIVNKDESLYKIASKYSVTAEELIELNPSLKSKKLKKGMKLYIPFATQKEEDIKQELIKYYYDNFVSLLNISYGEYLHDLELFLFFEYTEWIYVYNKFNLKKDERYYYYLSKANELV